MSTYNPAIPQASDRLNQSQQDILDNFTKADSSFGIDHFKFSDGTVDNGKHQHVNMPFKTGGTAPTTAAGEGAFYTVDNSSTTDAYYTRDNEATNVYRMTRIDNAKYAEFATNTALTTSVGTGTGGWTFLPGGLLFQYGKISSPGTSGTVTFPKAFTTGCYSLTLTIIRSASSSSQYLYVDSSTAIGPTLFKYTNSSSSSDFFWQAIGV